MTAAVHMDSPAHGHGPSHSTSTSPPWFPAGNHRLPRDFVASSAPTAAPPNHQHRPARRVAKRRPRPSRKQPTTYITADPASFRRMVHQVTGADDLPLAPPHPEIMTLCRPAPYRTGSAAAAPGGAMMLPTLDTSAFLLGAAESAPALERTEAGGRASCNYSSNSGSSCGVFPTLDSWPDDALLL